MRNTQDDYYSIGKLIWILVQYRWIVVGSVVLWTCIGIGVSLVLPEKWESRVQILPNSSGDAGSSGLAGLASLAGMQLPSSNSIEEFYSPIIVSPTFLEPFLDRKWKSVKGDSITLSTLFQLEKKTFKNKAASSDYFLQQILLAKIADAIEYNVTSDGVIVISVLTPDPCVSKSLLGAISEELETFIRKNKKEKASEQRMFIESQLDKFQADLKSSEYVLMNFRQKNALRNSPELQLREARLYREVTINSTLVTEFRKQLELARVEEVRGVEDLMIIENPRIPLYRASPKRKLIVIVSFLFGIFFGVALALLRAWWNVNRQSVITEFTKV